MMFRNILSFAVIAIGLSFAGAVSAQGSTPINGCGTPPADYNGSSCITQQACEAMLGDPSIAAATPIAGTCPADQVCCAAKYKTAPTPPSGLGGSVAPAAPVTQGSSMVLQDPLKGAGLFGMLGRIIQTFLGLVGAIALLVFVYAGVRYMTAGGNSSAITQAVDAMKYAFLGLAIIMFAYILASFVLDSLTGTGAQPAAEKEQRPVQYANPSP